MLPEGVRRALRLRLGVEEQAESEVEREIRHHLESRIEDLRSEGQTREEAERNALQEFGDVAAAQRALARQSSRRERTSRRREWWGDLKQDVRYGWRKLVSEPGFAVVAVLTLALGIGATTTIFSVVNAVLIQPLPYPEADRLVRIWEVAPDGDDRNVVSRGNFMDWRDRAGSFTLVGAHGWRGGSAYLTDEGEGLRVSSTSMTPNAFRALGVEPVLGRTFTEEEGRPGSDAVVVLGYEFWRDRLGGDADVLGRTLTIDGRRVRVVGVMPASFDFPEAGIDVYDVWELGEEDRQNRRSHNLQVLARLAPGVTVAQAQAELDAMAAGLADEYPAEMEGWGVNVQPYRADLTAEARPTLLMLLGVVGLVLLLACANLANLLLARARAREREVAVRGALGAGRRRLIHQFLTEAALIAILGGALGFAATAAGLDMFVALAPGDIPLIDDVTLDPTVFGFAAGATLLATALFGLLPALRASDADLQATLRSAGSRSGRRAHGRLRSGLLVAEVALAVILLVGAGLLLRSAVALQTQDYGFDRENIMTVSMNLDAARYPNGTPQQVEWFGRLLERVEALPGVIGAAGSSDMPAGFGSMTFSYAIEGRPSNTPSGREEDQPLRIVTPGYFETLRIPVLDGRVFSEQDDANGLPVVVVNQALADRHWPNGGAVGQRINFRPEEEQPWFEIIGVVGDTRHYGVDEEPTPAVYMAHAQKLWDWVSWLNIMVRTPGDPMAIAPAFLNVVHELDPEVVPGTIRSLTARYAATNAQRRFATILLAVFAGLALVLGVVGVYGVLSYAVAQRTRELGVRIALGASRGSVAGGVMARGVATAGLGAAIGVIAALALSRFLEGLVYGVGVRDPITFVGIPVILMAVAAAAAYVPARRATRVNPMEALRAE